MKKSRFPKARLFLLLSIVLLGSCTPMTAKTSQNGDLSGKVIESSLVRLTNLQVPQSDEQALSDGNRTFAVNLYQKLRAGDGNLFFSPYSISLALAMVSAGARGDTASQIAAAIQFTLPPDRLHPAINALDGYLESLGAAPKSSQPNQ
jgi:serpin B